MHCSCGVPVTPRTSCSVMGRNGMPSRSSTRFQPIAQVADVSHNVPSRSKTTESIGTPPMEGSAMRRFVLIVHIVLLVGVMQGVDEHSHGLETTVANTDVDLEQ